MICPNCRKPGAVLGEYTDFVLHWTCEECLLYGTIGEKEIDAFLTDIEGVYENIIFLQKTIGNLITERNDLKVEIADLNRLASDFDA